MKFHKCGRWFISFRTDIAYHLFALHCSMYFYIHRQINVYDKYRTRIGPFEYEYSRFRFKENNG